MNDPNRTLQEWERLVSAGARLARDVVEWDDKLKGAHYATHQSESLDEAREIAVNHATALLEELGELETR